MVELTREQIAAANEHGRIVRETQPHARSARYDAKADRVVVDLTNGATFAFPPRLVEGLRGNLSTDWVRFAANSLTSCVIFVEQNVGPHTEQTRAVLPPAAVSASKLRLNWSRQRNSKRARLN